MQFCTFYLEDDLLGVDVLKVQEVIRNQEMTVIPLAHPTVRGLMNLRGNIVSAIDMRHHLGYKPLDADAEPPVNVITRTPTGLVSLIVDRIGDVLDLDDENFEPVPGTVHSSGRKYINRVYKLKTHLLQVLDPEKVVDFADEANNRLLSGDRQPTNGLPRLTSGRA